MTPFQIRLHKINTVIKQKKDLTRKNKVFFYKVISLPFLSKK